MELEWMRLAARRKSRWLAAARVTLPTSLPWIGKNKLMRLA